MYNLIVLDLNKNTPGYIQLSLFFPTVFTDSEQLTAYPGGILYTTIPTLKTHNSISAGGWIDRYSHIFNKINWSVP